MFVIVIYVCIVEVRCIIEYVSCLGLPSSSSMLVLCVRGRGMRNRESERESRERG
jgi:hypothetical protein